MKRTVLLLCFTLAVVFSQTYGQGSQQPKPTQPPMETSEQLQEPYMPEDMLPEQELFTFLYQDEGMIVDDGRQQPEEQQVFDMSEQLVPEQQLMEQQLQNLTRRQAPSEFSSETDRRELCNTGGCLRGLRIRSALSNNRRTLTYTFDQFSSNCRVMQFALDLGNCDENEVRVVGCRRRTGGNIQCRQIARFENLLVISLSTCDSVSLVFSNPINVDRGTLVLRSVGPQSRCDTCDNLLIPLCPTQPKCGNRILERGEECDPPNSECCDRNCKFFDSRICRMSKGDCDMEETCTGRNSFCPKVQFERRGTRCRCRGREASESLETPMVGPGKNMFGMCKGDSPFCFRGNNRCE